MFGSKAVVGLDIGTDKVKAIQLRKKGGSYELERFGVADIHPGGDRRASGSDLQQLKIEATKRALENGRISAKYSVSAISGESIIVRYIQLPQMPDAELKNALRWEAEEYIPFSIDEVNLDSVILGRTGEGKVDVLLVCARKDLVNDHLEIVRGVGLTPLVVDVDSFAFLNCYEATYRPAPTDCVCLVNIGAAITNINIYVGGTSRFARDISIAGDAITNAIAQKSNSNFQRAEQLKQSMGAPVVEETEGTDEEESSLISSIRGTVERMTGSDFADDSAEAAAQKAMRNVLTNLVGEVRRSIQFFENQGGGATVQRLYLGGGTARMPKLSGWLGKELELPVDILDPLKNVTIGSGVDSAALNSVREHLGVGIGLSLRKAG